MRDGLTEDRREVTRIGGVLGDPATGRADLPKGVRVAVRTVGDRDDLHRTVGCRSLRSASRRVLSFDVACVVVLIPAVGEDDHAVDLSRVVIGLDRRDRSQYVVQTGPAVRPAGS